MLKKLSLLFLILPLLFTACTDNGDDGGENTNVTIDTTPPEIESTFPAIGATDVDKTIKQISVTFNEEMAGPYAFYPMSGYEFPGYDYSKPSDPYNSITIEWSTDMKTITISFEIPLTGNTDYGISINREDDDTFKDKSGNSLAPIEWTFTTEL